MIRTKFLRRATSQRIQTRNLNFIVVAKDFPNGLENRMKNRPIHLENALLAKESGFLLLGGATVNDSGEMDGSFMLFESQSKKEVDDYLEKDIYVKNKVWKSWSVKEFKMAAKSKHF